MTQYWRKKSRKMRCERDTKQVLNMNSFSWRKNITANPAKDRGAKEGRGSPAGLAGRKNPAVSAFSAIKASP
ncbi:MAG: hypothetical protein FWD39_03430 [Clostridiales bacterium]|nr:hypothetical protein [Clostridiales bacterium]